MVAVNGELGCSEGKEKFYWGGVGMKRQGRVAEVDKQGFSRGNTHISRAPGHHSLVCLWKDPERVGGVPFLRSETRVGAGGETSAAPEEKEAHPFPSVKG